MVNSRVVMCFFCFLFFVLHVCAHTKNMRPKVVLIVHKYHFRSAEFFFSISKPLQNCNGNV